MITVICGVPGAGKSTLAAHLARQSGAVIRATDDLIATVPWVRMPDVVCEWFAMPGDAIIEGVVTVRALRRWLALHPDGKPITEVYYCPTSLLEAPSSGQRGMIKSIRTIWRTIQYPLLCSNVHVILHGPS